jgi:hypothetical protein
MKVQLFALMLAVAAPLSAQAAGNNRSYVEFGYAQNGTQLTDIYSAFIHDYNGASIKGNWAFNDNWSASLGYAQGSSGNNLVDLDSQWSLGLAYNHSFSDKADVVFGLNYKNVSESFSTTGIDSDVWGAEVGVVGNGGKLNGGAFLGYEKWDSNNSYSLLNQDQGYLRLDGGVSFNDNWSLQAEYKLGFDTADNAFLGLRYSF